MEKRTRRRFLESAVVASGIGLVGCVGGDGGNDTDQDGDVTGDGTTDGTTDGDATGDGAGNGDDGAGDDGDGANMTDGEDGNATDADGNATDGDGNATDGDGNVTEGDGNATDGDGNVTDGDGNATDGNGNATDGGAAPTTDEYPSVERWLTTTEVGGAAESWDGAIEDRRGSDTVTVDVGAEGNDGAFAFAPAAVAISTGTTVEFRWTGEGNPHNVVADPEAQIGESDFTFSSGDPVGGSGVQYTQTFDETGVALYHCEPHLSLGMKGAIVVVE